MTFPSGTRKSSIKIEGVGGSKSYDSSTDDNPGTVPVAMFGGKLSSDTNRTANLVFDPAPSNTRDSRISYSIGVASIGVGTSNTCDANSPRPVRYLDGAAVMKFNDFISTDASRSMVRGWSNQSISADEQVITTGNGMSSEGFGYIEDLSGEYNTYLHNYTKTQ